MRTHMSPMYQNLKPFFIFSIVLSIMNIETSNRTLLRMSISLNNLLKKGLSIKLSIVSCFTKHCFCSLGLFPRFYCTLLWFTLKKKLNRFVKTLTSGKSPNNDANFCNNMKLWAASEQWVTDMINSSPFVFWASYIQMNKLRQGTNNAIHKIMEWVRHLSK